MISPAAPIPTQHPAHTSAVASALHPVQLAQPLILQLFKEADSPMLSRHRLQPADFRELAAEAWRDSCLRARHPAVPLRDLALHLHAVTDEAAPHRCLGFRLELIRPDGTTATQLFTIHSLRELADQLAGPLLTANALKPGEPFHFEVVVEPPLSTTAPVPMDAPPPQLRTEPGSHAGSPFTRPLQGVVRRAPLSFLHRPLQPLLDLSKPVALIDESVPPVFYTEEACARAEACARRGQPAGLETGGVLIGSLASCPDTGEFFTVVHDVIEVQDAEEKEFSLAYSGQTWQRIQRILRARQEAAPARAERLIGQAHGHPFRPNDGRVCAECLQRPTCTLSSAWASPDDHAWHRAVFAGQPWALCHIFGLSARGDNTHQLFGLRDGRLQARGFYLLTKFDLP